MLGDSFLMGARTFLFTLLLAQFSGRERGLQLFQTPRQLGLELELILVRKLGCHFSSVPKLHKKTDSRFFFCLQFNPSNRLICSQLKYRATNPEPRIVDVDIVVLSLSTDFET